ncbi:MAG: hypothetical protein V4685_08755 [Bacteroidota bacterium]
MKNQGKELLPLILLFIVFNNFFLFGKSWLAKHGIDYLVLIIANSIFFVVSLLIYQMQKRALKNSNPNVFVRAVMGGTMIKMAVCLIAVAIYALAFKNVFSKMSVFAAMFLYFFYMFVEVRMATKLNKKKNA